MTIQTGYAIASITSLKALTSSQRTDGYARLVKNIPAWYTFSSSSTATADDDAVLMPNDNPPTGRWIKSSGTGGAGSSFGGAIICNSECAIGGKAFMFYAPQSSVEINIQIGFDISITIGSDSIEIYRWSELPNISLSGMELIGNLPDTGGKINVTINSTYRWISIFAKNDSTGGIFDGVCFSAEGNTMTLIGFS